jgi:hypothetical protein
MKSAGACLQRSSAPYPRPQSKATATARQCRVSAVMIAFSIQAKGKPDVLASAISPDGQTAAIANYEDFSVGGIPRSKMTPTYEVAGRPASDSVFADRYRIARLNDNKWQRCSRLEFPLLIKVKGPPLAERPWRSRRLGQRAQADHAPVSVLRRPHGHHRDI